MQLRDNRLLRLQGLVHDDAQGKFPTGTVGSRQKAEGRLSKR